MLIDSHCHLDFPEFADDFAQVLHRAHQAGVHYMQSICTKLQDMPNIIAMCSEHEQLFCSTGVHPLNLTEAQIPTIEELLGFCAHHKVIGIGETGLDYHRLQEGDFEQKEMQKQSFVNHIKTSQQTGLPLIIHTRAAEEDTISILEQELEKTPFTAVMHCFTGSAKLAEAALKMGFYISASGIITFKNAADLRTVFAKVPLDRLLIETDAPYLAPVPQRSKRNEPAFIAHTAACLAEIKGVGKEEIAKCTTANFHRLFTRVPMINSAI